MNAPFGLLHESVERIGWVLLHSLWQGALIGAAFGLVRFSLRWRSPNLRYVAGCLALAVMVAAPIITVVVAASPEDHSSAGARDRDFSHLSLPAMGAEPMDSAGTGDRALWYLERILGLCARIAPVLAIGWAVGVGIFTIRLTLSWWGVRGLRHRENAAVDDGWVDMLNDLRCRLEISRPVRLLKSGLVEVPTVIGWLRPVILLPAATLVGLTPEQMQTILAHELGHVRRLDYLVNAFQCILETLMFYHPVVWWISRCVREERELCCDDLVLRVCGDRLTYAQALATLESTRPSLPELAFAASGGSLVSRIRRLLGAPDQEGPATVRQVAGLTLIGLGLAMLLAGIYLNLAPSRYVAMTRVLIGDIPGQFGSGVGSGKQEAPDAYFLQRDAEAIRSEAVLGRVVAELDLTTKWGDKYGRNGRLHSAEAINLVRARLEVRATAGSRVVEIRASSEQPQEAAAIANSVAHAYFDDRLHRRDATISAGVEALERSFAEQDKKVRTAQEEVDRLGEASRISEEADGSNAAEKLMSLLRRLEVMRIEAQTDYARQLALFTSLYKMNREKLIEAIPTVLQDGLLSSLLEQRTLVEQKLVVLKTDFGPENPEVVKTRNSLEDLKEKVERRVDGILFGLEAKASSTKAGLDALSKEIASATDHDMARAKVISPYLEAKRKLEELQRFNQILTMKIAAEKIDLNLPRSPLANIVDPAVPPRHAATPNRYAAAALILAGLLLDVIGLRLLKSKPHHLVAVAPAAVTPVA